MRSGGIRRWREVGGRRRVPYGACRVVFMLVLDNEGKSVSSSIIIH